MDFFYGDSNDSQASKVQSLDVSPINSQNFIGRGRFYPGPKTRILDPYASSDSSGSSANRILSPLARYLHSRSPVPFASDSPERRSLINTSSRSGSGGGGGVFRSPLALIENIEIPPAFRTPVKVEEDVVVMDGILVEPKHGARAKSLPSTSDSGGRLSSSTSGSDNSSHKSEVCRWWGDSGKCRFGSKCRFVHGKEDLRPTAFANRNQSEAPSSRSYSSGSCAYGPRGRSAHHQAHSAASSTESAAMATPTTVKKVVSTKDKEPPSSDSSPSSTTSTIAISGTDWSPLDDNIEVSLPCGEKCPSREDVDAHIQTVLYGLSGRKRLPVCVEFSEE
ncbi:PREDICTED: mRNA decay activator protein ZFP36L2-like [Nicotiana attenuata]|uniref:C3H1-type domain-containing protein n=1 Tax=Nicotiana attenuata TaxID=49451 RepID=A0A1J6IJC1_NICAT|nr:PREDICTED: mRNA decay activator protein ZFP36L2-like [Nicotiana attenuata]XP_019249953.1 PREDICTED: mRNA decay activator protein ZFP36L2-like [Nicotiana attenuata]XP_019249954.1 PREDICTED: mRNA decay activator protein ZFP36L2-like [Nicotiana attenuata]OIT00616.1 hypothetical protein A4A49_10219 [Nicotiana attenuata]